MLKRKKITMDGNMAAAHVAYAFTEVAAIYPITPSSPMADYTDVWSQEGRVNLWGQRVILSQMQSEGGAAGALHGALQGGALATTFTASQGLLLMIPNLYKMAGELLPGVIHVTARTVASHALSIFGDHSDIYACRQTGFAMLCSANVQEVMDLGAVAHLCAIAGRVPFMHFFDGFRTSHEIQKIGVWDYETLGELCDKDGVWDFKQRSLNPDHPVQRGTAQNPDVFFQYREACNPYYEAVPEIVASYMKQVNEKLGTDYGLVNFYGAKDATKVGIAMGSVCDALEETVDYLNGQGERVGVIKIHLYRPFPIKALQESLPETVSQIYVLDRTKEPGATGEPLYLDVVGALKEVSGEIDIYHGRYGLGGKDTTPADLTGMFHNEDKEEFTLGIEDDVTNLSISPVDGIQTTPTSTLSCKFWGLGSDGTVGANKNSIKIIGDNTDMFVQAYFDYDSKKSGGITISHLRFGKTPIRSSYLINKADFVACHAPAYVGKYGMVEDVKDGGVFLLNTPYNSQEVGEHLPSSMKSYMAKHHIQFYVIDGFGLGSKLGLGGRINTILQGAFFALSSVIPLDKAVEHMKKMARKTYEVKGEDVVIMNEKAIEAGVTGFERVEIPSQWADIDEDNVVRNQDAKQMLSQQEKYVKDVLIPVNAQRGNKIPVSHIARWADGTMPSGTASYEKRGIARIVPYWNPKGCIQCNFCSYVCPHACIRPMVLETKEEQPKGNITQLSGMEGLQFAVTISTLDCTGCSLCASVCPGNKKNDVLTMVSMEEGKEQQEMFDYGRTKEIPTEVLLKFPQNTVKGSQFRQPLLEFSGACSGCGETAYAKVVTQLFGEHMCIANATGCSSIWGGSLPSSPYTTNSMGQGPAWANSLFEDNAEYGFGMSLASRANQQVVVEAARRLLSRTGVEDVKQALQNYLDTLGDSGKNSAAVAAMVECMALVEEQDEDRQIILKNKEFAAKKSLWIFGGDGWAYDIGFGGLDHILASGEDVNILVFDTEVYSNTGGQASKATQLGAVAQFAAQGKETKKKDLAAMAMTYGDVYVAQIAQGANMNQMMKALCEAEGYFGPSLIIAYSPCINHGIKGGLRNTLHEEKRAVEAGYWHLFRYNPQRKKENENPFVLDSAAPTLDYEEFLENEIRFSRLYKSNPERAKELFSRASKEAAEKYERLLKKNSV